MSHFFSGCFQDFSSCGCMSVLWLLCFQVLIPLGFLVWSLLSFTIFVKWLMMIFLQIIFPPWSLSFLSGTLIIPSLIHSTFSHRSLSLWLFVFHSFFILFFRWNNLSSSLLILSSVVWNLLLNTFEQWIFLNRSPFEQWIFHFR